MNGTLYAVVDSLGLQMGCSGQIVFKYWSVGF